MSTDDQTLRCPRCGRDGTGTAGCPACRADGVAVNLELPLADLRGRDLASYSGVKDIDLVLRDAPPLRVVGESLSELRDLLEPSTA